jgi:TPR repeat protein
VTSADAAAPAVSDASARTCDADAGTLCADRDLERCTQQCDCNVYKACEKLADAYRTGTGVAPDRVHAAELFDKACKGGLQKSCGGLADSLRFGATPDKPRAAELYDKACDSGDVWSCNQLAEMKGTGDGIPHDKPGATKLYQKACDKGDPLGCASLGRAYLHGEGVKANKDKGIGLLRAAYKKGILWAADELKKIGVKP